MAWCTVTSSVANNWLRGWMLESPVSARIKLVLPERAKMYDRFLNLSSPYYLFCFRSKLLIIVFHTVSSILVIFFFSNLIYCMTCKRCNIQYVGQTKNRLMDRFQSHFYNIGHNRPGSEIGKHFNSPDHNGLDDVEITILDFIHAHPAGSKSKKLRDLIEFNWIQRLHSNAPTGLNVMDPVQP